MILIVLLFFDKYYYENGSTSPSPYGIALWVQLLAFIGAVLVGYIAHLRKKKREDKIKADEESKEEIALLNYVVSSLEQNVDAFNTQLKYIKEYIEQLKKISDTIHSKIETGVMFRSLETIHTAEFKRIFYKYYPFDELSGRTQIEYNFQDFSSLLSNANLLEKTYASIYKTNEDFIEFRTTEYLNYRENINLLDVSITKLKGKDKLSQFEEKAIQLLDNFNENSDDDKANIIFTKENILKPLRKLMDEHKNYDLLKELEFALTSILEVEVQYKNVSKRFKHFYESIEKSNERQKIVLKRLKKIKEFNS